MYRAYAGIGDGKTPDDVLEQFSSIAARLSELGYSTRVTGEKPVSNYFEKNSLEKELYLPWSPFEVEGEKLESKFSKVTTQAIEIMGEHYQAFKGKEWDELKPGVKKIISRNVHLLLGPELKTPVDFLICWTPCGAEKRKDISARTWFSGPVISLAHAKRIPVFNLKNPDAMKRLNEFLEEYHD